MHGSIAAMDRDDLTSDRLGICDLDLAQGAGGKFARDSGERQQRDPKALLHHLLGGLDVVELHYAGRHDAGLPEKCARELVVAGGAIEENQLFATERGHLDVPRGRERMLRIHDEHESILVEQRAFDLWVAQRTDETDVNLLAQHEGEHLLGVARLHAHTHPRVGGGEPAEGGRKDVRADGRCSTDRKAARAAAFQGVDLAPSIRERLECPHCIREECVAGFGQAHAAGRPHEERRAELLFQALKPRRERGLTQEELVGGPADTLESGDGDERTHLLQQHGINNIYCFYRMKRSLG
jgi:hypothetical protein